MAYPTPGQSWTINVYSVNVTSGKVSFTPSANSTVAVYVVDSGRIKTYNLLVDAQGSADFRYSPSESDIAFVAFSGNYSSEKIVFSAHYVPSDVIDTMLLSSSLMSGATGITGGLAVRGKRSRWLLFGLLVLTLSLFSLVIIGSLYSRFFLETVWGYPENVFSGFVTLSLLRYLTISGFLLFSALAFVVLVLHLKKKKMTKDDNPRRR
jgi:hypothetical protein